MVTRKYNKVAVIGAGISGVSAAAHLIKNGLEPVLFERSSAAGGVWHFDERSALEPLYPNAKPSFGDYVVRPAQPYSTPPPEFEDQKDFETAHAPPGPSYWGLKNNVSTRAMRTSIQAWPEGTQDYVKRQVLEEYIQATSNDHGVAAITQYNTRVEEVRKQGDEWVLRSTTLQKSEAGFHLLERRWVFDAVVVASGHYNMPHVPAWPGIGDWKAARPKDVWHSKRYRKPDELRGKNVLVIGAGVSSNDIIKESVAIANKIYQSARGGALDIPARLLPEKASRVAEVVSFNLDHDRLATAKETDPIPGTITLADGQVLSDIHTVVIATGYVTSYPFLPQLHNDDLPASEADEHVLVTKEGEQAHNLHKDIFYIKDPSLAFVGVPYHVATFSVFDFQAQIVARVFSGKAEVPPEDELRAEYKARVVKKSLGRSFHSLKDDNGEINYVKDLVEWANHDALRLGIDDPMVGHTPEWHQAYADSKEALKWLLSPEESRTGAPPASLQALVDAFTGVSEK